MGLELEDLSAFAFFNKQKLLQENKKLKRKHNEVNENVSTKKIKQQKVQDEKKSNAQVLKRNKAKTKAPSVLVNGKKKQAKVINGPKHTLHINGHSKSQIKRKVNPKQQAGTNVLKSKTKSHKNEDDMKQKINGTEPVANNLSIHSEVDNEKKILQLERISTKVQLKKKKSKKQTDANILKSKTKPRKREDVIKQKINGVEPVANNLVTHSEENDSEEEIPQLVEISTKTQSNKKNSKKQTDANVLISKTKKLKSEVVTELKINTTIPVPTDVPSNLSEDDSPSMNGLQLFKWLIHPLSPNDFFKKYWEQNCLLIERTSASYYKHIFSSEALDKILRDHPLFFTRNIDVVSYENGVKQTFNQEGRATPAILWDYYANGCSIRLLNPQTYHKQVHLLLATLQEYFGTMVGANTYLTPPGSQGFAPHYDDIEAFIVQLEGRKHWKLYKPKGADVLARDSSPNFKAEDLGSPFMEVTLNAGDLLYFPRGTIHEGRTDEEEHSLHITLSVYQHTAFADLLENVFPSALKKAAQSNVEFRKGLPLQYLQHVGHVNKERKSIVKNQIINKVKDLMKTLIDYIEIDDAADELGRKFMHDCMPPILMQSEVRRTSKGDGDFMKNGQVFNRVEIGLDTKVRLLRYHCLRLVPNESTANIYYCTDNAKVYHGEEEQWLEIEKPLISVVKTLQNSYPNYVEVESLPGSDVNSKLQLISDLWEKGLLVTEEPLPAFDDNDE